MLEWSSRPKEAPIHLAPHYARDQDRELLYRVDLWLDDAVQAPERARADLHARANQGQLQPQRLLPHAPQVRDGKQWPICRKHGLGDQLDKDAGRHCVPTLHVPDVDRIREQCCDEHSGRRGIMFTFVRFLFIVHSAKLRQSSIVTLRDDQCLAKERRNMEDEESESKKGKTTNVRPKKSGRQYTLLNV